MARAIAFLQPTSVEEAIEGLRAYGEEAKAVAGATALTILLRQRLLRPSALISLGGLPDLHDILCDDGHLTLGALVTHRQVELNPLVHESIPVLASTFGVVGNVRVRNAATVGGVLAEADYASDPPAVLLALDAEINVEGPGGSRTIPMKDFVKGFYETALCADEIITNVRIPIPSTGTRGVYEKYVTRSSEDRPCVGVAALVRMDGKTCQELRVAVGAAAEVPQRFPDIEARAHGQPLDDDLVHAVADAYAERIETLADMRGSAWYRTEMIRVWVRRAIMKAHA
jgi:aerobic carbon-monoxide dehydrogenase medium subunit